MADRCRSLRRTCVGLGTGELAAATTFGVLAVFTVMPLVDDAHGTAALWSALLPLLVILVQGGASWLLALGWVAQGSMPASAAVTFRVFRVFDVVLLGAGLAGVVVWWPASLGMALLVMGVWLFGVVEYVNYYVVRLAYPVNGWFTSVTAWRTPRLVKDLRATRR